MHFIKLTDLSDICSEYVIFKLISMKNRTKTALISFILGLVVMFVLDMVFHFNNSVEAQLKREIDKTQNKIENIFK